MRVWPFSFVSFRVLLGIPWRVESRHVVGGETIQQELHDRSNKTLILCCAVTQRSFWFPCAFVLSSLVKLFCCCFLWSCYSYGVVFTAHDDVLLMVTEYTWKCAGWYTGGSACVLQNLLRRSIIIPALGK